MSEFIRNCPDCGKELKYSRKSNLNYAIRVNGKCSHCAKVGKMNNTKEWRENISKALTGRKFTKEWKEKLRKASTGHKDSKETIKKKRIAMTGQKNPFYGKTHSAKTKRILRLKFHERMQAKYGKDGACPMYNPDACLIIEQYAKQNGYTFQHALNGGEFYIKELGYWVDGYDKDKNVVIEYYETHHRKNAEIKKDKRRIKEIKRVLNCKIIILKEWQPTPEIIN